MSGELDLSLSQMNGAWRTMCIGSAAFATQSEDGLEFVFSGLPIPFFNIAVLTDRGIRRVALRSRVARACAWAGDKGVPWLLVVTNEGLQASVDATAELDGCGFSHVISLTGMIATRVAPVDQVPGGLTLSVPESDASCAVLLDINSAAYGMELDAAKPLIGRQSFWANHVPVLGVSDGQPASCAAVLDVDGYRYVALVATHPTQQRRGFAEAAMRHALDAAASAHGERPTVLHATDAGRPLYARMGYAAISSHLCFVEKRFLEGH